MHGLLRMAAGYGMCWMVNTPEGRATAKKAWRAVMNVSAQAETAMLNAINPSKREEGAHAPEDDH